MDHTINATCVNPSTSFSFVTVFFYSSKIEDLPNVRYIGDLIYLRRFAFEKYDQKFQAKTNIGTYCSWALINGDSEIVETGEYQTSRVDMHLTEEKFEELPVAISELRSFARGYLEQNSILGALPQGVVPKDRDYIVLVAKKGEQGVSKVRRGKDEFNVQEVLSFAEEGEAAKLRSVSRIINHNGAKFVVPNNFTSLVPLRAWSFDAQRVLNTQEVEREEEEIFHTLD